MGWGARFKIVCEELTKKIKDKEIQEEGIFKYSNYDVTETSLISQKGNKI